MDVYLRFSVLCCPVCK